MKPIVKVPNEVLIKSAKDAQAVDKKIQRLIVDLKETLEKAENPKGVGLAAPQIGVSLRVFAMRPKENGPIRVIINPHILATSKDTVKGIPDRDNHIEGCLSIPNVWGAVERRKEVTLQFLDEDGNEHTEVFKGFPAIIIQHEVDHLDGILFTRRVLEQKGELYQQAKDENGKEVLEPIEL